MATKRYHETTVALAQTALFAALCYIGFQFLRIDIPLPGGKTALHLGNAFCVLAALLLGGVKGGLAGAVGMTIADLTSGYATSAADFYYEVLHWPDCRSRSASCRTSVRADRR